ncbi:hypothetical protein IMY05_011G0087700 [Salix suchowensis]|nr:hypothetical protein IMY05_011G0087700 [Salix suchowensis]
MELPRTTSSDSHPNSFTKFHVSSSTTTSRPSTTTSNVSTFNRPGDRVLHTTSSYLVFSKPARDILHADEEHTVAASTKIQRQSMINEAKPDFEAKLERLKKSSEMEAESNVAVEIAYIVNSLNVNFFLRQGLMLATHCDLI